MECDWEAQVGAGLPAIDACWPGFIDLSRLPEDVSRVTETTEHRALREALLHLNSTDSPLLSTKCDVWALTAEEIDPLEFDCAPLSGVSGLGCYIDLVLRNAEMFASFARHEEWARAAVHRMRQARSVSDNIAGRVDLVIRTAHADDRTGFGITLYAAGCGADAAAAHSEWSAILEHAVAVTMGAAPTSSDVGE